MPCSHTTYSGGPYHFTNRPPNLTSSTLPAAPACPLPSGQWYDTRTMTIIKDTTFANYKWQPQLGYYRMAVFYVRGPGAGRGGCEHCRCAESAGAGQWDV